MASVCIFSAAHRRLAVTRLVLQQRQRLCGELAERGIEARMLIVADDENLELAAEYGAETLREPNLPLGQKCNAGLRRAAQLAEHVVWVGSDDWIHPDAFEPLHDLDGQPTVITGRRIVIVDLAMARLRRLETPSKYGAIPWIIDSRLLRTTISPIRPDLQRGLDGALIRGLRRTRIGFIIRFHEMHEFRCVDFKTSDNITPYYGLAKHLGYGLEERDPWTTLARWYPVDLVEQARTLGKRVRKRSRDETPRPRAA